jgi:hypothetical protein
MRAKRNREEVVARGASIAVAMSAIGMSCRS